jgi:hypothetical protein
VKQQTGDFITKPRSIIIGLQPTPVILDLGLDYQVFNYSVSLLPHSLTLMKTLPNNPSGSATPLSATSASSHWLWWAFLLSVLAFAGMGPTCAMH